MEKDIINPVLYVILNGGLNMSAGKAAAQAVHAAMMLPEEHKYEFSDENRPYKRTVIVLEAKTGNQLERIAEYLKRAGIHYETYIDEGKNEVEAFSLTALAVETIDENDTEIREIFSALPLYKSAADRQKDAFAYDLAHTPIMLTDTMAQEATEPDYPDERVGRIEEQLKALHYVSTDNSAGIKELTYIVEEIKKEHETKKHYSRGRNWFSRLRS